MPHPRNISFPKKMTDRVSELGMSFHFPSGVNKQQRDAKGVRLVELPQYGRGQE